MSQVPEDEDGQLHTLGLLERLRSETTSFGERTMVSTNAWTNCCGSVGPSPAKIHIFVLCVTYQGRNQG